MKSFSQILNEKLSQLNKKYNVFFAFNPEQIKEQQKPGVRYTHLKYGLYCPIELVEKYNNELALIYNQSIIEAVQINGAIKIIEHEYWNYETQLTNDYKAPMRVLRGYQEIFPELFTNEIIIETFQKCYQIAVEKDLF